MAKIDVEKLREDEYERLISEKKITIPTPKMRKFETGATRDISEGKLDFEGFFHPLVLKAFAEYMEANRDTPLGKRDSDNWQKGIDRKVYMKSLTRHFMDVWLEHRGVETGEGLMKALMGVMFNSMGYAYELLRAGGDKNNAHKENKKEEKRY